MATPLDLPVEPARVRRITVGEFHQMADAGIFGEEERVELLEGVLIAVPPQSEPHSYPIQELNRFLVRALPDGFRVRPQLPVVLGNYSQPEPDLCVVTVGEGGRKTSHPEAALLVIEVAASSLRHDRKVKLPIYARFGIPEYWIVDVEGRAVDVHVDPDPVAGTYRTLTRVAGGGVLRATAVPLPDIAVDAILP